MSTIREEFNAGYNDARSRSSWTAFVHGAIKGGIAAIGTFWPLFHPAAWWKRLLGVVIAYLVLGMIVQFHRERSARPVA